MAAQCRGDFLHFAEPLVGGDAERRMDVVEGVRDTLGHFRWNLGRVASRFNGRVYIGNDPECRTAHPARICRNEDAVEHETYVRWACARHTRLRASCFLRDHRLSGLCGVGMVRFADFGAVRACGIDDLRDQHSRYVRP